MIQADKLTKRYGRIVAVDGVSLALERGKVLGLLGPNGAGKTTTVSMISGLVTPDAGEVRIDGHALRGDTNPAKRRLGLVPQDLALYDELTARDNLEFFGALYDLAGAALDQRIASVLTTVGLADRALDRVKTFSGGMKRRLNLAAGLLHDPDVLLLDEPTVGVDPQSRNAIFDNLEMLKANGKALLYTTHYMEEAERLADRIIVIDHGRVIADDTLSGLTKGKGSLESVFLSHRTEPPRLMAIIPIRAMLRKDFKIFFSDRRAVITAFAMPIMIASFFGVIFKGASGGSSASRIDVLVVNNDTGGIAKAIVIGILGDSNLSATMTTLDTARDRVRRGTSPVAIVIPAGFGDAAGRAFFGNNDRPVIDVLYDPSHSTERAMVGGIIAGLVMQSVSREMFGGQRGRTLIDETLSNLASTGMPPGQRQALAQMLMSVKNFNNSGQGAAGSGPVGISMPYDMHAEAVTARANVTYNSFAHAFAGMGIQFLLMTAINLGVDVLLERQRGIWKRLRSAPLSRATLLSGKLFSGAAIGALVLLVSFLFAIVVWKVRIDGSLAGFLGVAISCALMAAAYGLLIASLGKAPNSARGVSIFATLLMVMLGGAWVPTFIFPSWLQKITVAIPTRWAMDGFDATTWRGLGFDAAIGPITALLGFAAVFLLIAVNRFRWEET